MTPTSLADGTAQTCSADGGNAASTSTAPAVTTDDHTVAGEPTPLALRAAAAFVASGLEVPSWVGLLALLEEYVTTWDRPEAHPRRRYHQTYATFGYRCACPMCTRRNVEAHHEPPRSRGGRDRPQDLVAVCPPHHAHGLHGTTLACRGNGPSGFVWRVGRSDVAELWQNERRLAAAPLPRRRER